MITLDNKESLIPVNPPRKVSFKIDEDPRCSCLLLCPGLLLRQITMDEPDKVAVDFQINDPVLEFGCLLSGQISGAALSGKGQKRYVDAKAGQTWCSFTKQTRGSVAYLPGQPICIISFIIYDSFLKNLSFFEFDKTKLKTHASGNDSFHCFGRVTPEISKILYQIEQLGENKETANQLLLISRAYELLFHLSAIVREDHGNLQSREKYQCVKRAQYILDNNLASPPNLVTLAKQSGLCVTHLTQEFKKQFGTTVFGYLRQKRLARAKELITLYHMNSSEAAWEVGYSSLSSFTKAFYACYGVTPGSFLRKNEK